MLGFFYYTYWILPILLIIAIIVSILLFLGGIAFSTVFERKTIAVLQNRRGPNKAGLFGLLQAIGDGVKLVTKAQVSKKQTSILLYYFAPFCALFLSWLLAFYLLFSSFDDFSLYFLLIWTSLNVYSLPLAGIVTSHSKFAFLGGIRSLSQLLSYELSFSVLLLTIVVHTNTPILGEILEFQKSNTSLFFSMMPVFFVWFIIILAETNRVPFDLPEAEAELVAGFATEYSSFAFAAFFLAEYGSMLVYSYLTALLFFYPFNTTLCAVFMFFIFVWTRVTFPRYKVDQLLWIGWYSLLPMTLVLYFIYFFNFNLLDIFTSIIPLFTFFVNKEILNNKYQFVSENKELFLRKNDNTMSYFSGFDFERTKEPVTFLSTKPIYSSFWIWLPLFNFIGSFYQLLCISSHNVYTT